MFAHHGNSAPKALEEFRMKVGQVQAEREPTSVFVFEVSSPEFQAIFSHLF